MENPLEIITKQFLSVLCEFGFTVDYAYYSAETMGNSIVVFNNQVTGVKVVIDRSQVLISIGKISEQQDDWFELSDVVQFYNRSLKEVYIFPEGNTYYLERIENQVVRLANIMRNDCIQLLRGDFSDERGIREVEKKRVTEMLIKYNLNT